MQLSRGLVDDVDQRRVIDLPADASGVVVGAPGTGKTSAVVARTAALIRRGAAPEEILVITPTRTAATALRDELAIAVGVATPGPLARSVAAFAYQIVRASLVHADAEPPQLLTGPDEDRIVQDLLEGDAEDERAGVVRWPVWLPAEVRGTKGFRAEVRAFLAEMTSLGIDHVELARRAGEREVEVWHAMASFAREYHGVRARLRGAHRDAAGLVQEAVALLRTLPGGAPQLGALGRLKVVLVDDAQELTLGGIALLEALRTRGVAVLAFGDPDVGSGAFRGASPENFARLAAEGPLHVLRGAHRGTAAHRDLIAEVTSRIGAAGIVAHRRRPGAGSDDRGAATEQSVPHPDAPRADPPRPDPSLSNDPDDSVRVHVVRSAAEEYDTIARLLRERHVHDGVAWEQCAVIAHDARQVAALEDELSARDVPTGATGPTRTLASSSAVRDLLRMVDLAALDPEHWDADAVTDALRGAGMDAVELRRLRTALRHCALQRDEESLPTARELLASGMRHPLEFELIDTREGRRAARVAQTLELLRIQLAEGATAHELLWTAWERSGRERAWHEASRGSGPLAEQAGRDLDAVVALFQSAKRHGEREDGTSPLAFLRGILDSDVAEDRLSTPAPVGTVRVMTPAGALGAEFDTVVVAGVQEGVWPNLRVRGSLLETWRLGLPEGVDPRTVDRRRGVLHDELRLFARAVSRARERLIVTAVDDDDTGPSVLFEMLPPAQPAPRSAEHPLSLRGLVAQHRRMLTADGVPEPVRREAAAQLALLADAGVAGADPGDWYGLSSPTSMAPLYDLAVEPARLSPSKLQAIDDCQLNWVIGELGADSGTVVAGLGTLIHAALEHADGSDEDALWRAVEERWGELEFEAGWIERSERARARDLIARLSRYLRDAEKAGTRLVSAEPRFALEVPVDGAALPAVMTGTVDRVELTSDGRVVIVDLKTGRSESTSAAAAATNPQLSAYQLAFESGAIPGVEGRESAGAKLLVLKKTRHAEYATPSQPPFDEETRAAFLARISAAVQVVGSREFLAPYEAHCRDDHTYGLCRIHTVGPVSSS